MTSQLDSFEAELLTDLRTIVATRAAEPDSVPRRTRRRRWLLAPAGIAAGAVAGLLFLPGIGPQPAYAVTVDGRGGVHVRVTRLDDASGLQAALAKHDIAADVQYLGDDMQCAPDRYADAPTHRGAFSFSAGDGYGYRVDLAPGVIRAGETLVIAASRISPTGDPDGDGLSDDGGSWITVGVAVGPVGPCVQVPAEDPPSA